VQPESDHPPKRKRPGGNRGERKALQGHDTMNLQRAAAGGNNVPDLSGNISTLTALVGGPDGVVRRFKGRFAWTLARLLEAGENGCTPIDKPAPRWSHYVWRLRGDGISIETIEEPHGGAYAGRHARYVLRTPLVVIAATKAGASNV
jgi:hypothetical protein